MKKLASIVGDASVPKGGCGPLRTMLESQRFDEVHVLSNYPVWANRAYASWLGVKVTFHKVTIVNPTDYDSIFRVADAELKSITDGHSSQPTELVILLSPGTPAMAAVWVLLGRSKYPATFYQTFEGKAWETPVPFDLAVDLIPEVLREADAAFHHLAAYSPQEVEGFERIIGNSKAIRLAVGRARKAALRDVSVLLLGESGTGKELFARAIHTASRRKNGPFVVVNCAAIPRALLESEMFGHVKGAFTGAVSARDGAFKRADGGTLFLDEIGECDPAVQAKLLRVLQPHVNGASLCKREFQPVGASDSVTSDVRVIAATNRNLLQCVEEGEFREDLYYRLAVISIRLPPLRERKTDIPAIASTILAQINAAFEEQEPGYEHKHLSGSANRFVKRHDWPGNVRELANVLAQAAVMAAGQDLGAEDLATSLGEVPGGRQEGSLTQPLGDGFDLDKHLERIQAHYLRRAMEQAGGVKAQAARLLGIRNYQTLDAQLKRLKVDWRETP